MTFVFCDKVRKKQVMAAYIFSLYFLYFLQEYHLKLNYSRNR